MQALQMLDGYYPFLLILEQVRCLNRLPGFVPKFTVRHDLLQGRVSISKTATSSEADFQLDHKMGHGPYSPEQQKTFLRGVFEDNGDMGDMLASLVLADGGPGRAVAEQTTVRTSVDQPFSLDEYVSHQLRNRPWLLKTWKRLFPVMCSFLKI